MAKSFEGLWQLDVLNGSLDAESNQYALAAGMVMSPEGESMGNYHIGADTLTLSIIMPTMTEVAPWSLRVTIRLRGSLVGEHMFGSVDAIFSDGEPLRVAQCAFHRLRPGE